MESHMPSIDEYDRYWTRCPRCCRRWHPADGEHECDPRVPDALDRAEALDEDYRNGERDELELETYERDRARAADDY